LKRTDTSPDGVGDAGSADADAPYSRVFRGFPQAGAVARAYALEFPSRVFHRPRWVPSASRQRWLP